jgi:hypothetical protein
MSTASSIASNTPGDLVSMGSAVLPGGDVARDLVSTIGLVLAQEAA